MTRTAPAGVRAELRRGLAWVEEGHGGDGLKPETVAWARRLAAGESITRDKAVKMRAWLARHKVDSSGKGYRPGEDGYPSPGRVAWALWGGDPAVAWSERMVSSFEDDMEKRDYTAEERRAMADKGEAMPDGSFPVANAADLKAAIQSIGRAKDRAKVEAHLRRRAKALGLTDTLPDWLTGKVGKSSPGEVELPYPLTPEGLTPAMRATMPEPMQSAFIEVYNCLCGVGVEEERAMSRAMDTVRWDLGWCQAQDGSYYRMVPEGAPLGEGDMMEAEDMGEMGKAGRVLSGTNEAKLRAAAEAILSVLDAAAPKAPAEDVGKAGAILKIDEAQRTVTGWASVVVDAAGRAVVDLQGDVIDQADLRKAMIDYMADSRVVKVDHAGPRVGTTVELLTIDDDVAKMLGLTTKIRGTVYTRRYDTTPEGEAAWQAQVLAKKAGKTTMSSIGGTAQRVPAV